MRRRGRLACCGEFLGSGCTTEATGILAVRPDGDGLSRAIELALADADLPPDRVGLVVAHGNGTLASDASEAMAIRRVFGENLPPVTAFKWAVGHTIAASGALDVVLALTALEQGVVPGIATLECLDPQLAPLPVSREPQSPRSDIALVLNRGFGGMNVALVRARSRRRHRSMTPDPSQLPGPGLDTVEIARVERLLRERTPEELRRLFTEVELQDAGEGPQRAARLAARFAAKEACCKLFPRETALGVIGPADFSIRRDAYGAPCVELSREAPMRSGPPLPCRHPRVAHPH